MNDNERPVPGRVTRTDSYCTETGVKSGTVSYMVTATYACKCCSDPVTAAGTLCALCTDALCSPPGLECGRDDASVREHDRYGWR